VLFATGVWIGGVILLAAGLASGALLASAIRHEPSSGIARMARKALTRAGGFATFALRASLTWASALVSLADIRRRRHRLRRELRGQLAPLGEAVHRQDRARAERLKAHAAQLDQAVEEADRQAEAVLDRTRQEVREERSTVEATETLPRLRSGPSGRRHEATSQPSR
jgi:hypothetical protein